MNDDDITLAEAAARLHHSDRWLRAELAADRRRAHPVLQLHHHIGRTPLWTEREFRMLKAALIAQGKARRAKEQSARPGSRSSSATAAGTSPELST
jgi:hypothetical protein